MPLESLRSCCLHPPCAGPASGAEQPRQLVEPVAADRALRGGSGCGAAFNSLHRGDAAHAGPGRAWRCRSAASRSAPTANTWRPPAATPTWPDHPSEKNHEVAVWDVDAVARMVRSLSGFTQIPKGVAYSPDGKFLAVCSRDCTIRVWSAKTGRSRTSSRGRRASWRSWRGAPTADSSPAGARATPAGPWSWGRPGRASGGRPRPRQRRNPLRRLESQRPLSGAVRGNTLRVWEVATGKEAQCIRRLRSCLWFGPDSQTPSRSARSCSSTASRTAGCCPCSAATPAASPPSPSVPTA